MLLFELIWGAVSKEAGWLLGGHPAVSLSLAYIRN